MPQRSVLVKILDLVDNALEQGRVVYIHSLNTGGIEDALAGCWLVRHGMTGNQAIEKLQQAHSETLDGWRQIPYKERARKLIRGWKE